MADNDTGSDGPAVISIEVRLWGGGCSAAFGRALSETITVHSDIHGGKKKNKDVAGVVAA